MTKSFFLAVIERLEEKREGLTTLSDIDLLRFNQGYIRAMRDILDIEMEASE